MLSDIPGSKPWSFEMVKIALMLRCCEYDVLKGSFLEAQKLGSHILYSEEMKSGLALPLLLTRLCLYKSTKSLSLPRPVMTVPVSEV